MKKKVLFFLINVPVWTAILAFVYSIGIDRYYSNPEFVSGYSYVISYSVIMLFWMLAGFYLFYSWLVPRYLIQNKSKKFFWLAATWVLLAGPMLINLLSGSNLYLHKREVVIDYYFEDPFRFMISWLLLMVFSLIPAFLGTLSRLAFDSFYNIEKTRELENRNLQQEIQMIKSKLNPHLFFNTLNNIDTLIETNPGKASATLARLSDLLRYVVYNTDTEFIPISMEVDNLERYVELEKIRLHYPESVSFSANVLSHTLIPPMIFFPFVENGFKHSNLNLPDQSLQIEIFQKENKIVFHCVNTMAVKQPTAESGGVGLELASKRLELLFPQKHKLNISQNGNKFSILLEINS